VEALQHPDLDPLLFGSPLRRPTVAKAVVACLAVLLLVAVAMSLFTLLAMGRDVTAVFARALAVTTALSIVPLAILWYLDRRERESPWLFAIAFLWGGLIATWIAMPLNTLILLDVGDWVAHNPQVKEVLGGEAALMIGAPIAAPLVEESIKALGVVLLFVLARAEFDNMRDGFIYGALVGAGFTWLEAALYVAQGYEQFGKAPWGQQIGARYALFGLSGHVLFTGLFGAFLGLARQMRKRWLRYLLPILGLAIAVGAHALNNALPLVLTLMSSAAGEAPPQKPEPPPDMGFGEAFATASAMDLIVFLPFVALLAYLLYRSGRWELDVIRSELATEPADCVTAEERRQIETIGLFGTRRIAGVLPRRSAELVRLQHELAFRKRRLRDRGEDPESDPLVAHWRASIRRLRQTSAL
jgi:RsiW-degrading membrane proteinase PrsW (M82 family)